LVWTRPMVLQVLNRADEATLTAYPCARQHSRVHRHRLTPSAARGLPVWSASAAAAGAGRKPPRRFRGTWCKAHATRSARHLGRLAELLGWRDQYSTVTVSYPTAASHPPARLDHTGPRRELLALLLVVCLATAYLALAMRVYCWATYSPTHEFDE